MNLPKFPHSAIFFGVTGCGKTEILIENVLNSVVSNFLENP